MHRFLYSVRNGWLITKTDASYSWSDVRTYISHQMMIYGSILAKSNVG